jgi:threonine aldolase
LATHANDKAKQLADGIAALPHVRLIHPPAANMLFVNMARRLHRRAMTAGAHYYLHPFAASLDGPDDERLDARLVCSWCTTDQEVDRFLNLIHGQD